jgi:hypothetical protein
MKAVNISARAGIAQSVQRLNTGWTVRGSNPGGGEVFRTRPDRPWGSPCLLYSGYWVFSRGKAAGAWRCPPTPSRAEVNPLTPNDHYSGRTASLTSKRCILYISTNIGIEYFKHGIYSPCFSLQNAVYFIILTYLVPVLLAFYIQDVLKLKK